MNKITIIIPIHEYDEKVSKYLSGAIESITKQENCEYKPEVLIVLPSAFDQNKIREEVLIDGNISYEFIVNNGNTDYQSQVNLALQSVSTEYFSVLEYDDEYSTTFLKNTNKYIESYPDVDTFLTMMIEVNDNNDGIKLTNETVWAQQFVGENGEIGYLNLDSLKQYTDFKLSGAIFKTENFKNIGGYKSKIKLTFMYEYLLRALNNAHKIMAIPKILYKHLATREDSMFDVYFKTMSITERKFWFETAMKESNYNTDRDIDESIILK